MDEYEYRESVAKSFESIAETFESWARGHFDVTQVTNAEIRGVGDAIQILSRSIDHMQG